MYTCSSSFDQGLTNCTIYAVLLHKRNVYRQQNRTGTIADKKQSKGQRGSIFSCGMLLDNWLTFACKILSKMVKEYASEEET